MVLRPGGGVTWTPATFDIKLRDLPEGVFFSCKGTARNREPAFMEQLGKLERILTREYEGREKRSLDATDWVNVVKAVVDMYSAEGDFRKA